MGPKKKRLRQKEQQDQAEEQKRRYRKMDQTDSPEIPDRGGDIRNPRPPFECREKEVGCTGIGR